jgi:hypothetical protein
MDIQGYIIDQWLGKMDSEHQVLTVYDSDKLYYSLLPMAQERNIKVIDTTTNKLPNREEATKYWTDTLPNDKEARMLIYRQCEMPKTNDQKILDPYIGLTQTGIVFPIGPKDQYENMCKSFLPGKEEAIDKLIGNGNASFNNINALQEGVTYPELENLTKGKSLNEIVVNLLALEQTPNSKWMSEWRSFGETYLPGLQCDGNSLSTIKQKLWQYLLFSEFVHDLPVALPDSLKSVAICPKEQTVNINNICSSIRNRNDLREDYVEQSQSIVNRFHLDKLFAKAENLGKIVTFAFENIVEYEIYLDYLSKGDYQNASLTLRKNQDNVWYQADSSVALFWNLVRQCEIMMKVIRDSSTPIDDLNSLAEWYAKIGYKIDMAFRKYQTILSQSADDNPQIAELSKLVYTNYRSFTEQVQQKYQQLVYKEGYPISSIDKNIEVWEKYIAPLLEKKKKVAVMMADAFRFEMGQEITEIVTRNNEVECKPSSAFAPTVTRFGMAALLPKAKDKLRLVVENEKLMPAIDGKIIETPSDRVNYIKENIPAHVHVMDITSDKLANAIVDDHVNLLIIRSTKIDTSGESIQGIGLAEMEN